MPRNAFHILTPEQFRQIGEDAFGAKWQAELSRAMNWPRGYANQVVNKQKHLSPAMAKKLIEVCSAQRETLKSRSRRLRANLARLNRTLDD